MSILNTAAEDIFNNMPDVVDALFTPKEGGTPISIKARYKKKLELQQEGNDSLVTAEYQEIDLLFSQLPRSPIKGDLITIDSTDYTVQMRIKDDGRFVKVAVT